MKKMVTIVELPSFLSQIDDTIKATERDELIGFLAKYPDAGEVIPGTGGVRKLRWSDRGKGKRGGLRVIYYFYNETAPLFLLTVYGKSVQDDLNTDQKKRIAALAKILKSECKERKSHAQAKYSQ